MSTTLPTSPPASPALAPKPDTVFISYAHDSASPAPADPPPTPPQTQSEVVFDIHARLLRDSFPCWIDKKRIHLGDDWREEIQLGLNSSRCLLAFLNTKAVHSSVVCQKERDFAIQTTRPVAVILLEPLGEREISFVLSRLQWLDLRDWQKHNTTAAEWESWLAPHVEKIKAFIERGTCFRGEITNLREQLEPVDDTAYLPIRCSGFVGREWLADEVEKWRNNPNAKKVFALTGGPGSGKTAFAAHITEQSRGPDNPFNVVAYHRCQTDSGLDDVRFSPSAIFRTLIFHLALRLPAFRASLQNSLIGFTKDDIHAKSSESLFKDHLLTPLLRIAADYAHEPPSLIVIDALDEVPLQNNTIHPVLAIVRTLAGELPSWIRILITTRPERRFHADLEGFPFETHEFAENPQDNIADVAAFLRKNLADVPAAAIKEIASRSEGNFQYARVIADNRAQFDFTRPEKFPRGLSAVYLAYFRKKYPAPEIYRDTVAPLLELVCAKTVESTDNFLGLRPLSDDLARWILQKQFGWKKHVIQNVLSAASTFILRREETNVPAVLFPHHRSLAEWLHDSDKSHEYCLEQEGATWLATHLWSEFESYETSDRKADVLDTLAYYLYAAPQWKNLGVLDKLFALLEKQLRFASALLVGKQRVTLAEKQYGEFHHETVWKQFNLVDLFIGQSQFKAARTIFDKIHPQLEIMAKAHPETPNVLRNLFASFNRLGELSLALKKHEEAELYFKRALELSKQLFEVRPEDSQTLRDISVSCNKLGELFLALKKYKEAEHYFKRALNLREQLLKARPENLQALRDIAASCDRFGHLLLDLKQHKEAERHFKRAWKLGKQLLETHPKDPQAQQDFAVSCNKLGELLLDLKQHKEAEHYFKQAFELGKQLLRGHSDDPITLQNIAASYDRLGRLFLDFGKYDESERYFRQLLHLSEQLLRAFPENPQNQRDLLVSYFNLIKLHLQTSQKAKARVWLDRTFDYIDSGINSFVKDEARPTFETLKTQMTYTPKPILTDNVILPSELLELTEQLAENTHEQWAAQRIKDGWMYGPRRDDATHQHPCLVPYSELPDSEKEYDRITALQTLKAIVALGWKIQKQ